MEVAAIYTEFRHSLLRYIRSKVNSKEDAEDILQNVFMKISSNLVNLSNHEKLRSWIFTITRNAIIDYYRVNAARKNLAMKMEDGVVAEEETNPENGLDRCLSDMINLLPEEYRDIIIDSELKEIKQKALAVKYGMAYSSMRSRVQRGRERLKQLFYNCCHIETDRLGNVLEVRGRGVCEGPCDPSC